MGRPWKTLEERFWPKVDRRGPDDCWEWKAVRTRNGYGQFQVRVDGRFRGKMAHRIAYELLVGPLPNDLQCLCHRCDNPPCVNPAHMFPGTFGDNARDMIAKNRGRDRHGETSNLAKLNDEKVIAIRTRLAAGEYWKDIALEYGLNPITVYYIKRGKTWRHLL